jgi:tetratricopeptide (TPR) repeat protein
MRQDDDSCSVDDAREDDAGWRGVKPGQGGIPSAPTALDKAWPWLVTLTLIILILIAFMPALTASFVDWDDDDLLFLETRYRSVDLDSLWWMLTTSYTGHFQPLTWLSYSLDWALWKRESFGYHLTNVLLHVLTAICFYFVVRRLLAFGANRECAVDTSGYAAARSVPGPAASRTLLSVSAAVAAALFAVHPLRVESVAWIAERRDVLSGVFFVLAVLFYLRHAGSRLPVASGVTVDPPAAPARWPYWAAFACCVLSLLAKANAVTLPFVLLVLDVYPLRRLGRSEVSPPGMTRRVLLEKLPFLVVCAAGGAQALIAQSEQGALYPLAEHDVISRVAQACYGLMFYVWKTLWPSDLGPLYDIPARDVLLGPMFWQSAGVVVALAAIAVYSRRRLPAVTAALVFYVIQVSPLLGFAQSGPQLVADRYSYLPCMGFAILAGALIVRLASHHRPGGDGGNRALIALAVAGVLAVYANATFHQSDIWRSSLTLWRRGVAISPNSSIAHVNYADALAAADVPRGAIFEYARGLELNPRDVIAAHHFADVLARVGHNTRAAAMYERTLELKPDLAVVYPKLAQVLGAAERPHDAAELLRGWLGQTPGDLEAALFLADLLSTYPDESVRNGEEAEALARRVNEARRGEDGAVLLTLASALAEAGRFDESITVAEDALRIAEETSDRRLLDELERRLRLFSDNKPYHFGD